MKRLLYIFFVFAFLSVSYAADDDDGGDDIIINVVPGGLSGTGITTRYWDCCKPSCAWIENTKTVNPVNSCEADGETVIDAEVQSGCIGGHSYMCNNQQPYAINDTFSLGFVAASFTGGADVALCCACMLLDFQDSLTGKQMVVQITNTGGDLGQNQFDIALPGGGVGIFTEGCATQWNAPNSGWGDQYGGVSSEAECDLLPEELQSGCKYRFEYMNNVSNPGVRFTEVECPEQLIAISGCSL